MPFVTVGGATLHYYDMGSGKPIVFVHGNGSSLKMYESEIKFYATRNRVISFDLPGHGKSPDEKVVGNLSYWEYCGQVLGKALKKLNISDFTIIGINGGAIVALYLADNNQAVKGVFADSFEGNTITVNRANDIIRQREHLRRFLFFRFFYRYIYGNYWRRLLDNDSERIINFAQHGGTFFVDPIHVFCPVFLTCSAKDQIIPDIVQKMNNLAKLIPNSRVVVFEGGKHPSCLSNKRSYRTMVNEFIYDCE